MLFIGIAMLVIGHQTWLRVRGWQFNVLSPYFMCDLIIFALIGLGSLVAPLSHQDFIEELLFCLYVWSGLMAYYLGLHLRLPLPRLSCGMPKLKRSRRCAGLRAMLHTTILTGGFVFMVILTLFGRARSLKLDLREMMVLSPLQIHSLVTAEGVGALPIAVIYLLTVLLLMHMYQVLRQRDFISAFWIYLLINFSYFLISSTRVPLIMNLVIPIAYYHYAIRRINKLLLAGIILGAPIVLTLLHGFRGGYNLFAFKVSYILISETGVLRSFHHLWQEYISGNLALEYGLNYYYFFLTFIPKDVWKTKPLTSFEARWTVNLYGSLLKDGQVWISTFTPWGEGLAQFGLVGGIINLFIYGLILKAAIRFFNRRPHACLVYFFYSILSATYIRTSVQSLLFTTVLYIIGVWLYERWFMS
ncbi:MAG: hypothetical protein QXS54_01975 [Candidatus Methanomethylicaceae archaeon]